jgi:hypothetical protein
MKNMREMNYSVMGWGIFFYFFLPLVGEGERVKGKDKDGGKEGRVVGWMSGKLPR